jgi:hypothetical protein
MQDKIHTDAGVILESGIATHSDDDLLHRHPSYLLEEWNSIKHDSFSGRARREVEIKDSGKG